MASKDLERELEEDISFTREGIKDFGVHDMGDPRKGKRSPIDIVMEWKFDVSPEDIARNERADEFEKATRWLGKQLGFTITDKPRENIEMVCAADVTMRAKNGCGKDTCCAAHWSC